MKKKDKALLIWIPLIALLCNSAAYLVVRQVRASKSAVSGSPTALTGGPALTTATEDASKDESARARRATGLAALEAGDYEKALINFTEAKALVGDRARVDELLRVTDDLRSRARSKAQPPVASATPAVPPSPVSRWSPQVRSLAARPAPPARPASPEPAPLEARSPGSGGAGLLLVTTVPRGLLVQVDGAPVDLTPMRTSLKTGTHRVALLDGDRRLYETSIDVTDGNATTVLRDLSAEMGGEPPRSAGVGTPLKDESNRPPPAAPAVIETGGPSAARPPSANEPGGLDITSPGIYGVVWVNDRAYGFPPIKVRDLPPGPTRVEVRVNGVEKRATTVVVQPGLTTPLTMR